MSLIDLTQFLSGGRSVSSNGHPVLLMRSCVRFTIVNTTLSKFYSLNRVAVLWTLVLHQRLAQIK